MRTIAMAGIVAIGACFSAIAQSGTISGPTAACLTERGLNEMANAQAEQDMRQIQALLDQGQCVNIEGRQYSVVDRGLMRSQVCVYAGGDSVILWTRTESIR